MAEEWERQPMSTAEKIIVTFLVFGIIAQFFNMKFEGSKWF